MAYWYCLKDGRVEGDVGCANAERLGPFETETQAAHALELARERNEAWQQEDERWNGEKGEK